MAATAFTNGRATLIEAIPVMHARYIRNVTSKGNPSVKQTNRAVQYIGYGHKFENPREYLRGQWHSPNGEVSHDQVKAWAEDQAQQRRYTYTLVLSVRDGIMQDDDFVETVKEMSEKSEGNDFSTDWRMMVHRDSDHDHAHVMLFRDRTLQKAQLARWREEIQAALAIREAQRLTEQQEQGIVRERALYGGAFLG